MVRIRTAPYCMAVVLYAYVTEMENLKTLVVVLCLLPAMAQDDDCVEVQSGLSVILDPCRQSVQSCVEATDLAGTSALFCVPRARGQYNNFLECSGATFTNQVFGALCSGANCTEGPFTECVVGARCFEQVGLNTGAQAYETCQCNSNQTLDEILSECPQGCAAELEQLVNDQGCCSNTTPYVLYFSTCGAQTANSDDAIDRLFGVCNMTLPNPCYQPFQDASVMVKETVGLLMMLLAFATIL